MNGQCIGIGGRLWPCTFRRRPVISNRRHACMGRTFQSISNELREWVAEQRVFFVATAPLAGDGHVNCSPKGGDTLRVLGERAVAYLDLTGSGVETIAHLQDNGRIVVMLCAFAGPPRIVRFHGTGEVIYPPGREV
jgi:predicted pyridoxine 5'-phosphate oxidase superfamily flavin-nucleotide-binding protein